MLDKIPEAEMVKIAPKSHNERRAVMDFVPRIGLSIVNYAEVDRIDTFYLQCQSYRDYYRDPYDRLHKPLMFTKPMGKCGMKVDRSAEELRQPIRWVQAKKPIIDAINYRTDMNLGAKFSEIFRGRYSKDTCIRYKR
ncbi:hypothetical protein KR093_007368 [Drosophila rubida]|uniref:Uncharacterized protein n=1 Tax=Drosophila rubida TaxID=30044 RepID=A0AAD4PNV3_9MUSC|nr:hypothetical protein KR093_007368 [Drosophila rubida]